MSDGTTHYENCWQSGARHYKCAVKELAACSSAFDKQQKQLDRNADQIASKQAQIDRLMMEYCPDEMSFEQIARWKKHQVVKEKKK